METEIILAGGPVELIAVGLEVGIAILDIDEGDHQLDRVAELLTDEVR